MSTPFPSATTKCGTLVPNRIFVGGLSASTTKAELSALFQTYGRIKATKIIVDRAGVSKGYGFITFETEEEAQKIIDEADGLILKDRKLNVRPAVKKMNATSVVGDTSVPGSPVFAGRGIFQASYPVMLQQPLYVPQCHYPTTASSSASYQQYVYSPVTPDFFCYPVGSSQSSADCQESSSDAASDVSRFNFDDQPTKENSTTGKPYSKHSSVQTSGSDMDSLSSASKSNPASPSPAYRYATTAQVPTSTQSPYHLHQMFHPKTSVALMAYPGSIVVGTPTLLQVKESNEHEVLPDFVFNSPLHSQMAAGTMTPPQTPHASLPCDPQGLHSSLDLARKN